MKWFRRLSFLGLLAVLVFGVNLALIHPDTPLPEEWNPTEPFDIAHPLSPLTDWKLRTVEAEPSSCLRELAAAGAKFTPMPDFEESESCHIRNRVRLEGLGEVRLRPVDTRCDTALRLAVWERHGLRDAASALGTHITEIHHQGSYNCRRMRTSSGSSTRWSTHATGRGFNVRGFTLATGDQIELREAWDNPAIGGFLRAAQTGACDVFGLVLGPNYNALHADHFHIQTTGNGCL